MGALEAVFNSTKFDLNDEVLMRFDDYFDKRDRAYNSFSLDDEEDIIFLRNFVAQIKSIDSESAVYVATYGYEITNSKGEKSHTLILFGLTQFFLFLKLRKLSKNVGLMNLVIFLLLKIVVKTAMDIFGL